MFSKEYLNASILNLGNNAGIHKVETWMESDSNFTGIVKYASKGKNIALSEMFIGRFKARNKEIEMYNSRSWHPSNDLLDGCMMIGRK